MESLSSFQMDKYPRDLLRRLVSRNDTSSSSRSEFEETNEVDEEEEEELELNLGLSLGGRFGVDKSANKRDKLVRSSSISVTMPFFRERGDEPAPAASYAAGLMRASSLPTEKEEEWRKRKELQTLRRLAAKRRRSEKQKSSGGSNSNVKTEEEEKCEVPGAPPPFWAAVTAARQAVAPLARGKSDILGVFQGFGLQPSSRAGSVEESSQGGGGSSSGMSELESKPLQGSSSCGEARSPARNQDQRSIQNPTLRSSGSLPPENTFRTSEADVDNMCKKPNPCENRGRETRINAMEDMPCVFTKGDGPNGRKIEGILYRYAKGEEVRIMCVCHGTFLSPAEFVKHAGGGDVTNPLRHIVVNSGATSFL